jgi:hypothetical protein
VAVVASAAVVAAAVADAKSGAQAFQPVRRLKRLIDFTLSPPVERVKVMG